MRSDHAKQRGEEGRPVKVAFNDAQKARQADIFIQPDQRYIIRGQGSREHVFEKTGELVTSLVRSKKFHKRMLLKQKRQPITKQQFEQFQKLFVK